jgi:hypothetical protein
MNGKGGLNPLRGPWAALTALARMVSLRPEDRKGSRARGPRPGKKESDLHAQFVRLKSRRGPKQAVVAVAASMLIAEYFMLHHGVGCTDLGGTPEEARIPRSAPY